MPIDDAAGVRVRFAPSPTGFLHIGGLRTALYNYLFARKHGGRFVLRIEDTDRERLVEAAGQDIRDALAWAGLDFDEGPELGGPFAPYRQSERKDRYRRYAQALIEGGHAYYAFDTQDELERARERAEGTFRYGAVTRQEMRNALTLPAAEVEALVQDGAEYVVRLKVPRHESVRFQDLVRGTVSFPAEELDDQVLLKSDGMPTYHLANVVDDHHMGITHVIRGEEWLPSTPKHILMYEALGWEPPAMAHLPLILSPEGGKLSKRDADELGIPVFVKEYREAGYEPEALINFLAFLGWNPGTEQELFSLDELTKAFSIDRVGASGVQFDADKLTWYNQQHLKQLVPEALAQRARPALEAADYAPDEGYLTEVAALMQERISFAGDLATEHAFFWKDPDDYDEKGVEKRWKDDSADLLRAYADRLEAADRFDESATEETLRTLADAHDVGAGRVIHPTRLAVSGRSYGPSLFAMMAVLGRDRCVRRLRRAADVLG